MNNLPTEPGFYWWREKDGDEWEIVQIDLHMDAHFIGGDMCYGAAECGGQWQRCIRPDEGQECFAVRAPSGQFIEIATQEHCEYRANDLNESDMFLDGQEYDVVPVLVARRQQ